MISQNEKERIKDQLFYIDRLLVLYAAQKREHKNDNRINTK